jgi:RHS repeat-associated protein
VDYCAGDRKKGGAAVRKILSVLIFFGCYGISLADAPFQLGELTWIHNYGTNAAQKTIQLPSGYTIVSDDPDIRGNDGAQAYFGYSSSESSIDVTPSGSKSLGTYKGRLNVTLRDSENVSYPNCWVLLTEKVASSTRFFSTANYPYFDWRWGSSFTDWQYYPDYGTAQTGYIKARSEAAPAGVTGMFGVKGTCNGIETWVLASFGSFPGGYSVITPGTLFSFSGISGTEITTIPATDLSTYVFDPAWGWHYTGGAGPVRVVELRASYVNITTYSLDADAQTWGSHDGPVEPDTVCPKNADTKEPINFISGNNHFSGIDLTIPAPGILLSFGLTYNSSETNSSPVGPGWHHLYDWSLTESEDRSTVRTGDARVYSFAKEGGGAYSASFDNNWQLVEQTNTGTHTLTLPGGLIYQFSTNGMLQSVSDDWNNAILLTYSNGLLASAEHSNGQSLQFAYSNGLLSSVTAATNLNISFSYASGGVMTQAVRNGGAKQFVETYNYDDALLMTQKVDSVGSHYHYLYDTNSGKATGMYLTDDRWYEHTVEYSNASSRVIYFRDDEALVHDYNYNSATKRVLEDRFESITGKVTYAYDNGGNVTQETTYDANTNRWMQVYRLYDNRHNVTNEAFGLSATPTNITRYTWHSEWQTLTSITDPEGFKQEYEYTNGSLSLERIYLSSNQTTETKYSYTTNGLLSAITNANGHSTVFTYDTRGYPQSVIPQAGPVMTFGYDLLGHLTNSALPGGRQTGYTVNPLGWVERIETADSRYETFQYNGLGKVTNQVDRAGRIASYVYAPGGKLTAVSRQLGNTNVTVSYAFDQQFNTLAICDELGRPVESYALDPLDRPVTVTNLEGQTMSISYLVGDFVDSITRFDGTIVSNQYNGDGRLAAVAYPDETNLYTYLKNGLVRTLVNSKGNVSNSWNMAGWLTSVSSQPSVSSVYSVVNYSYDSVGNVTNSVVSIDNPQSQIVNAYQYDQAERLREIFTTEGTETQSFVYAYNPDNGLVASVSNANLRADYEYDLMDRITSIDWLNSSGASILSFDYQYNAAGIITNRVLTGGSGSVTTGYQYDDLDRLTSESSATSEVNYSYDAAGNRLSKQNSDNTVSYTLGSGNRLASWSAASTNDFLSKRTLRVQGYSSEAIGTDNRWGQLYVSNSVAVTPETSGTNFWIDGFVTGLGTQQVVAAIRDQAGNMGYATNEFCLTVVTNGTYQYNAAGCLTNIAYSGADYAQNVSLGWNSQYQLTNSTVLTASATSTVNYAYDVLGRRKSRAEGTNVENYVYTGNQVAADLDGNGNVLRSYTWGPGIDNLLAFTDHTTSNTYYALKDHLNTVHALIDASGQIVERYEFDAWGRVLGIYDADGAELTQSAVGNRYLWQGREYDFATGLYYFRARWYDPISARWLSKDPIGISGGLNMYAFCGNNSVNKTDPLGLCEKTPWYETTWDSFLYDFWYTDETQALLIYFGMNEASIAPMIASIANYGSVGKFLGSSGPIFGRGGTGLLNNNPVLRIGWGWKGTRITGSEVFRIAWGSSGTWIHGHFDLWVK